MQELQEPWVRSLGWGDPLEEGMAIHSSILAWRIPMDRGAWWAIVHEVAKSRTQLSDLHFPLLLSVYMIFVGPVPSVGLPWWLRW